MGIFTSTDDSSLSCAITLRLSLCDSINCFVLTEDILSLATRQASENNQFTSSTTSATNNSNSNTPSQLTHIRLDCTPTQSQWLTTSAAAAEAASGGRSSSRAAGGSGHGNRSSRPNSPGRGGPSSGATASASKVMRRKRTGE